MSHTPNVIIIGGGMAGMTTALCFKKINAINKANNGPKYNYTVYEARPEPSMIGGAINLTPTALRYFAYLDVLPRLQKRGYPVRSIEVFSMHSGKWLSELRFDDIPGCEFSAIRIMRKDLLEALLETFAMSNDNGDDQEEIKYGKKVVKVGEMRKLDGKELEHEVQFQDGTTASANLILGCDGIHSVIRSEIIEAEREPTYSGLAVAYGLAKLEDIHSKIHFRDTCINMSQTGALMTTYCEVEKKLIVFTAVMEISAQGSREGWKVRGDDQKKLHNEIKARFGGRRIECLDEMIEKVGELHLYPVYNLPPRGKWSHGGALLLGDAAHAMPPQGESTGFAIEDAVLLTQIMHKRPDFDVSQIISKYETLRKPRIDKAFKDAQFRWERAKNRGRLGFRIQTLIVPPFLWWTRRSRQKDFAFDVRKLQL